MHAFLIHHAPALPEHADILHIQPSPTSISIDQIRQLVSFLSSKPLSLPTKSVYLHSAHTLTLPAQHALLKVLEEPPGQVLIYLVTTQPNLLLPTILSRVQITTAVTTPDVTTSAELLAKLLSLDLGHRLELIGDQAFTRQSALEFLDHLEFILHSQLSTHYSLSPIPYSLISNTRKYLKSNVNLTLALDYFVLNLTN